MKFSATTCAIVSAAILSLSGCAQNGVSTDNGANLGARLGSSVGSVVSGLDHKTGVYVSPEQMNTFTAGRTTKNDVINAVGHPPQKSEVAGKEVWTYTYTHIPALPFQKNVFENTVFEFNRNGSLHSVYKAGGTPGKSGNALLDAAGM